MATTTNLVVELTIVPYKSSRLCSYLVHFLSTGSKNKKNASKKSSYIFRKWNFLALILRKFLIFQETETPYGTFLYFRKWKPKKTSYISGSNLTRKKKKKIQPKKISNTSGNGSPEKISYIFSIESFSYISENRNPEKIPCISFQETELSYISGSKTFLYFGKGIFRILAYLELEAYSEP